MNTCHWLLFEDAQDHLNDLRRLAELLVQKVLSDQLHLPPLQLGPPQLLEVLHRLQRHLQEHDHDYL